MRSIQLEDVPPFNLTQRPTYENRNPQGVVDTILSQFPDVVGLQEVNYRTSSGTTKNWFNDYLDSANGLTQNGYTMVKGSKNHDDSYNPIFFKTERFELISSGTYWLTNTPSAVSRISGSDYYRFMTWAFLKEKDTDKVIMFVNTHLDTAGEDVRRTQAEYLVQYTKALNTGNYPVFIFGDFNSKYIWQDSTRGAASSVIINDLLWVDALSIAESKTNDTGTEAAGFDFDGRVLPIDLFFVPQNNCIVNEYEVLNNYVIGSLTDSSNLYSGTYPSDHLPVWIDVTLMFN